MLLHGIGIKIFDNIQALSRRQELTMTSQQGGPYVNVDGIVVVIGRIKIRIEFTIHQAGGTKTYFVGNSLIRMRYV